jgi:hypothetical protein
MMQHKPKILVLVRLRKLLCKDRFMRTIDRTLGYGIADVLPLVVVYIRSCCDAGNSINCHLKSQRAIPCCASSSIML